VPLRSENIHPKGECQAGEREDNSAMLLNGVLRRLIGVLDLLEFLT
jgi:hypothetical protein